MSVVKYTVHARWVVGRVIGTKTPKTAKVRVTRLVLDPHLLKYYNKRKTYFAQDTLEQCTVGDVVLLKAMAEPPSKLVKHELAEIVYKVGRVVDPLTGKRVAGYDYLEPLTGPSREVGDEMSEKLQELNISGGGTESPLAPTS